MNGSRGHVSNLVHLVYLVFPAFQPLFDPDAGWPDWLLVAGIIGTFVPLYVLAMRRPAWSRWLCTVPATVIGVAATPFNAGAAVLFVYAAAVAAVSESRRTALRWFAGLTLLVSVLTVVSPVPMPWRLWGLIPPLVFIWIIGLTRLEDADRERDAAELRLRNARIEHLAAVSERERIARDLHDLLGHSLTAVVMRAQLIGVDPARARTEAAEIERTAREALTEVRAAVSGWRQASLDEELDAARTALVGAGVRLLVRRDDDLVLVGSTEHALALALREAVTNVARHAGARTCRVDIGAHDGELRLVIADDGVGGQAAEGNGLAGMRERVTALGGRVLRAGTAGTTVTIAVPLRVAT
ncbi:sensor histidine kinase [Qaidamihabitans albus]|uniref:sensor histidine kinase n=1 Tax=Qaidamihabitans albus TaxID=2795733 RepID=UPI0018F17FC2|nr:sensor histidine kinase [Qaidamihabitans albus]